MRWSQTLIPTLRQSPADAMVPSHQLMLRAGLIQQVAAGSYSYLPLGWRVLHKAMQIIREEMDAAGAVEVFLPTLQPIELWEQTGRREAYGDNLFTVEDRHGRVQPLGPTHEEVITDLIRRTVTTYRNLPITLYQIQTKFRDEFRPRFGVLRSREFQMKDAYSFDLTVEGLNKSYDAMFEAYQRAFKRCGLDFVTVEAESGPIGGSASHEFMVLTETGEDTILFSDKGNYAANVEKCEIGPRPVPPPFSREPQASAVESPAPTGDLEKVHTPGMASIEDVCKFMKVKPKHVLKTLVFAATTISVEDSAKVSQVYRESNPQQPFVVTGDVDYYLVVVRGDHDVNEAKVRRVLQDRLSHLSEEPYSRVELLDLASASSYGFPIGFVGPHLAVDYEKTGDPRITLIVDVDATQQQFWVAGANEPDHHVKHFDWKREVLDNIEEPRVIVADIRNAVEGDPSPKNDGGVLKTAKGIEIGHVFKLGTRYSDALNVTVLDEKQQPRKIIMGCYGIGVNRILASAIEMERGHDDRGIIWPKAIAPYHVVITPIKYEGQAKEVADRLYAELKASGVDVLLDDRDERPGVKFNDADLIGIPLRITIGDKGLANGEVEWKLRTAEKAEMVKVDQAVERAVEFVKS